MNVAGYGGWVAFSLLVTYGVRWFDPAFVSSLSRDTGFTARKAWLLATVAFLWMWLPILAGAEVGDGKLWVIGISVTGVGFFVAVLGASSIDEYRLLRRVPRLDPEDVSVGIEEPIVATSGTPEPMAGGARGTSPPRTPFSAKPAVHTDWLVQERKRFVTRKIWQNVASGVRSSTFTLGDGAVEVAPGDHRVFAQEENRFVVEPDADLPDAAADAFRDHDSLPPPEAMENPMQVIETYVPADEPVTVVGAAEQTREPGVVRIDEGPIDELLGTHTDHSAGGSDGDVVIVAGGFEAAESGLRQRVFWLGGGGAAMVLGGQVLSFWLSAATLSGLLG